MKSLDTIRTERLILRWWEESDSLPFSQMNADPEVMEFFPKALSREESDALIQRIEGSFSERGYGLWAAELRAGGEFIGFIGFNYTDFPSDFTPCVEIGWRLARRAWGKGYATEGAKACLQAGFEKLGFDKIFSFTSRINTRSVNVMKKIGLTYVKGFDHPRIANESRLRSHVLYGLARVEFVARSIAS